MSNTQVTATGDQKSRRNKQKEVKVTFGTVTEKNLGQLKILNSVVFPVHYNDKFYANLLRSPELCQLAYYNDVLVGAVCCRLEKKDQNSKDLRLYIMTLGVLAPYRQLKIGTQLLNFVFQCAKQRPDISEIYLHVQTNNDEAIAFYKKFGFEIKETIKNYYSKIEPPDCYVLTKTVERSTTEPPKTQEAKG
jgi:ribosomal protein S18 acetylase RimI-like enzyme